MSALFINKIGDLFFMLAIVLAIGLFSDLSLSTIFSIIPHLNPDLIFILSICFIGAAAAKSALIPLHSWLPKAKEGQGYIGYKKERSKGRYLNGIRNYSTKSNKEKNSILLPKLIEKNVIKKYKKRIIKEERSSNRKNHNIKSLKNIPNEILQWLVGFTDGEGCFHIGTKNNY